MNTYEAKGQRRSIDRETEMHDEHIDSERTTNKISNRRRITEADLLTVEVVCVVCS